MKKTKILMLAIVFVFSQMAFFGMPLEVAAAEHGLENIFASTVSGNGLTMTDNVSSRSLANGESFTFKVKVKNDNAQAMSINWIHTKINVSGRDTELCDLSTGTSIPAGEEREYTCVLQLTDTVFGRIFEKQASWSYFGSSYDEINANQIPITFRMSVGNGKDKYTIVQAYNYSGYTPPEGGSNEDDIVWANPNNLKVGNNSFSVKVKKNTKTIRDLKVKFNQVDDLVLCDNFDTDTTSDTNFNIYTCSKNLTADEMSYITTNADNLEEKSRVSDNDRETKTVATVRFTNNTYYHKVLSLEEVADVKFVDNSGVYADGKVTGVKVKNNGGEDASVDTVWYKGPERIASVDADGNVLYPCDQGGVSVVTAGEVTLNECSVTLAANERVEVKLFVTSDNNHTDALDNIFINNENDGGDGEDGEDGELTDGFLWVSPNELVDGSNDFEFQIENPTSTISSVEFKIPVVESLGGDDISIGIATRAITDEYFKYTKTVDISLEEILSKKDAIDTNLTFDKDNQTVIMARVTFDDDHKASYEKVVDLDVEDGEGEGEPEDLDIDFIFDSENVFNVGEAKIQVRVKNNNSFDYGIEEVVFQKRTNQSWSDITCYGGVSGCLRVNSESEAGCECEWKEGNTVANNLPIRIGIKLNQENDFVYSDGSYKIDIINDSDDYYTASELQAFGGVNYNEDKDRDDLTGVVESFYGLSDNIFSQDGDDYGDLIELINGYDPFSSNSMALFTDINFETNYSYSVFTGDAIIKKLPELDRFKEKKTGQNVKSSSNVLSELKTKLSQIKNSNTTPRVTRVSADLIDSISISSSYYKAYAYGGYSPLEIYFTMYAIDKNGVDPDFNFVHPTIPASVFRSTAKYEKAIEALNEHIEPTV